MAQLNRVVPQFTCRDPDALIVFQCTRQHRCPDGTGCYVLQPCSQVQLEHAREDQGDRNDASHHGEGVLRVDEFRKQKPNESSIRWPSERNGKREGGGASTAPLVFF